MGKQALQNEASTINLELTDPKAAYEAMQKLVSETEGELARIHGELNVLTQAWKAMTWNDYEFDMDAWHRLMAASVAQVEVLRAHVEEEDVNRRLRPTEEERTEAARKDKAVDILFRGARLVIANEPGSDKIAQVMESVLSEDA